MSDIPLLEARDVARNFGSVVSLSGVSLKLFTGENKGKLMVQVSDEPKR